MPSESIDSDENPRATHHARANVGRTMIGEDIALTLKIVVAGGFGAGKSTLIGSVSEIRPLHSEEELSERETGSGPGRGDTGGVERKTSTTVAMDFGRITIHSGLSLHLFGTPGQDRFRFLWEELCEGALAAVVLADTRRLEDCFAAVDHFERRRIPFVVAVNRFPGAPDHTEHDVAQALDLDGGTPVVLCDARDRASGKEVLIRTVEYAGRMHTARLLASVG
ncbi:GTP-binding protein [Streptomyces rubiginosohelvolus]|uniref:ATP-binding protein n=1 Tax=Streptomyces rubiginosohelvolus TaxID=67362 RepID=A0ABQ3BGX9_9ACTN|nr:MULTISPECIES: ATP/GTP-binding protein [Streptomyces]GGR97768.1 ATP-binding protein [Streptomyces rubiginosohelvolus]GGZ44794.1 ATP-binding protein [Streptomyces pluricolorescens]